MREGEFHQSELEVDFKQETMIHISQGEVSVRNMLCPEMQLTVSPGASLTRSLFSARLGPTLAKYSLNFCAIIFGSLTTWLLILISLTHGGVLQKLLTMLLRTCQVF